MSLLLWCQTAIIFSALQYGSGQTICPTFGTNRPSQLIRSNEERIFMNFEAPSQCSGNVTGWRFCFYRNSGVDEDCGDDETCYFDAQFMVYRRVTETSNDYNLIQGSVTEKTFTWSTVRRSSFTCMEDILNTQEYFEIQENDIVGACIKDVGSRYPLLLVGTTSGSNYRTYQLDKSRYQSCTSSEVRTVDTSDSNFVHRREYTLHLYANIATTHACTAGDNPSPVNSPTSSLSGTYLNVGSPVPSCGNYITKWHYCYYTEAATPGSTLSMTVAVWSFSQETNIFVLSPGSNLTITLNPIQTLAKIVCIEKTLSENDYVFVSQGDTIGIVLPVTNAIPAIGVNAGSGNIVSSNLHSGSPRNVAVSELVPIDSNLHVYVTIEQRVITTSAELTSTTAADSTSKEISSDISPVSKVTDELNSMSPGSNENDRFLSTNSELANTPKAFDLYERVQTTASVSMENSNDLGGFLSNGDIAAIVLSIILCLVAAILIFGFVCIRWKKSKRIVTSTKPGFANVMYDVPGNPSEDGKISFERKEEQPYYSEPTIKKLDNFDLTENSPDYEFVEDNYTTTINSAYAVEQELELLRRGSSVHNEHNVYTNPGSNEDEIYSFLRKKMIKNISGNSIM